MRKNVVRYYEVSVIRRFGYVRFGQITFGGIFFSARQRFGEMAFLENDVAPLYKYTYTI